MLLTLILTTTFVLHFMVYGEGFNMHFFTIAGIGSKETLYLILACLAERFSKEKDAT